MAYISINPDLRDSGFFKKKSEIGLPNVDNMSAAEFVDSVSEDMKILNNKKKKSGIIQSRGGEYFGGILKSASKSTHASFTLGLFNSVSPEKELASVHVDFAFSCTSSDEYGNLTYTICCPEQDLYLKNLYLIFSQVGENLYITLHTPSFPDPTFSYYFNTLGLDLEEWTEGVTKLPLGKDISELVKNHEIARVKLNGACTTIGSGSSDGLSVYDQQGKRTTSNSFHSLEGYDYPSINDVPFIGRRGFTVGNKEEGRHITIPAYHKDGSLSGAGEHLWEVLGDLRKINVSKTSTKVTPKKVSPIPNSDNLNYGLVKPTKYNILPKGQPNTEIALSWLESLGDETDVITVGALKEILSYLLGIESTVSTYYLYPENSEDSYKYISFNKGTIVIPIHSSLKITGGTKNSTTSKSITAKSDNPWIDIEDIIEYDSDKSIWNVVISVDNNASGQNRVGNITITQEESGRTIDLEISQSSFTVSYGILYDNKRTVFNGEGISLNRWKNESTTETHTIVPIKSSLIDPRGYTEINNPEIFSATSRSNWMSGTLTGNTLTLEAEANSMSLERSGTVYIGVLENSGENVVYIPIYCSQSAATSRLEVNGNSSSSTLSYSVEKGHSTLTLSVYSNYPWFISEESLPYWISLKGYSGERDSGTSNLTIDIEENTTQSVRTAEFKIETKGGSERTIQITQSSKTVYIDINGLPQDQFFSFGGDSFSLTVNSNVNWFIDQCPEWLIPSNYDDGSLSKTPGNKNKDVTINFTRNNSVTPGRGEIGVVSFSYYDVETETIFSLRKITVQPEIEIFTNSSVYVYPQGIPTDLRIPSSGKSVTVRAKSNCNYKMLLGEEIQGNLTDYEEMLSGYTKNSVYTSDEYEEDDEFTLLSFDVTENPRATGRSFTFALIPENVSSSSIEEFPIFTVTQEGNKSVIPVVLDDSDMTTFSGKSLGFYVSTRTGETTNIRPVTTTLRTAVDTVHECFKAVKGQIIFLASEANIYFSKKKTLKLGDTLKRIWGVNPGDDTYKYWYVVEETGYYFTSTGNAIVATPKSSDEFIISSETTGFDLTLLSVAKKSWDFYGDSIPGWLSLERISGTPGIDKIKVVVDNNQDVINRSAVLQFYVDSLEKTVKSLSISQSGIDISFGITNYVGILPVIGSSGTAFSYNEFEVGLSALIDYSSKIIVNGEEHSYTYSEYQDSGVVFSLPKNCSWAEITKDSYGKPKLHVKKNMEADPRSLQITATYNDKSGDLTIHQGTSEITYFYTYSNLEITPNYETIPYGASKIGFSVKGTTTLKHIVTKTGETIIDSNSTGRIRFPVMHDNIQVSDCGLILSTPETLEYIGELTGDVVITYPYTYFEKEGNTVKALKGTVSTSPITLKEPKKVGKIDIASTLLSDVGPGKTLTASWTKNNLDSVSISSKIYDTDILSYMEYVLKNNEVVLVPKDIVVKLKKAPTEYNKDRVVTYIIKNNVSKIIKYIHFRNNRATPEIQTNLKESSNPSPTNTTTTAKVEVASSIGYTSTPRFNTNNPGDIQIVGGDVQTSELSSLGNTKIVRYNSFNQPTRKWSKKYATESIILRDSDYYGITKEVPIILPTTSGSFTLLDGSKLVNGNSYDLYLPYEGDNFGSVSTKFYISCYEPYSLNTSSSIDSGLSIEDSRDWIEKQVGSLKTLSFTITSTIPNSSSNDIFLGTVSVGSSLRNVQINVYRKSPYGEVEITSLPTLGKNKVFVVGTNSQVEFQHSHPGWRMEAIDLEPYNTYTYPKINGNDNTTIASGDTWGNPSEKTSTVTLNYSGIITNNNLNDTLELVRVDDNLITNKLSRKTPGKYGIKSASTDLIQTSPSSVEVTDSFEVMVRPKRPEFKIYQKDSDGHYGEVLHLTAKCTDSQTSNPDGSTTIGSYALEFYIWSDLFERTSEYVGETLMVDGEDIDIENIGSVYKDLINISDIEYTETQVAGTEILSSNTFHIQVGEPNQYITDSSSGKTYAYYRVILSTGHEVYPGSEIDGEIIRTGKMNVEMGDFVIDSSYYQADSLIVGQILNINF